MAHCRSEPMARMIEIGLSILALVTAAPLILLIALAIKFESPGPVFERFTAIARDGRRVTMLRFRTTVDDGAWQPGYSVFCRPRMTAFGKFLFESRLHAIPLLISLWKGDLSLMEDGRLDRRLLD